MANENVKQKKDDLVPLRLPLTHDPNVDEYPEFASFNFKNYLIKRGETVMVPPALKARFEEIEQIEDEAYNYSQKVSLARAEKEFKQQMGL